MKIDPSPAAPVVHINGLAMYVQIRIDSADDNEIVRLAIEMAERRSRPVVLGALTTHLGATHDN